METDRRKTGEPERFPSYCIKQLHSKAQFQYVLHPVNKPTRFWQFYLQKYTPNFSMETQSSPLTRMKYNVQIWTAIAP